MAINNTTEFNNVGVNQKHIALKVYNIDDNYLAIDPEKTEVVDGGIELIFEIDKITIGWNSDRELFDITDSNISDLFGNVEFYELDKFQLSLGKSFSMSSLKSIDSKWNWYEELDVNYEPVGIKKYIPYELVLKFEDGRILQISAVAVIDNENKILKFAYDSQRELLISLDGIVAIESFS